MDAGNWTQVVWKGSQHLPAQPSLQRYSFISETGTYYLVQAGL